MTSGTEKSILRRLLVRIPIRIYIIDINIYGQPLLILVVIKVKEDKDVTNHINIRCGHITNPVLMLYDILNMTL